MNMDKDFCTRCRFLDKRYDRGSDNRIPFCNFKNTFLKYLKACPLQTDDCFK